MHSGIVLQLAWLENMPAWIVGAGLLLIGLLALSVVFISSNPLVAFPGALLMIIGIYVLLFIPGDFKLLDEESHEVAYEKRIFLPIFDSPFIMFS